MSATPTTPVTAAPADLVQVLTRIAEALEVQNERLSDIRASVTGVNLAIQNAAGCL